MSEINRFSHVSVLVEIEEASPEIRQVLAYAEFGEYQNPIIRQVFVYVEMPVGDTAVETYGVRFGDNTTIVGRGSELSGDRAGWNVVDYPEIHARDIAEETWEYHKNPDGPPADGEANTASNVGTGAGVYKEKVDVDLRFKTLVAGDNITITVTDNEVIISSTGGGGGFLMGWNPTDAESDIELTDIIP
jgi:hypothetical protein